MDKNTIKDKFQAIADKVQEKLAGWDKEVNLYKDVEDKTQRIESLEKEAKYWKQKFDAMWSAWHTLALKTVGKEEAEKMAEQMKGG